VDYEPDQTPSSKLQLEKTGEEYEKTDFPPWLRENKLFGTKILSTLNPDKIELLPLSLVVQRTSFEGEKITVFEFLLRSSACNPDITYSEMSISFNPGKLSLNEGKSRIDKFEV